MNTDYLLKYLRSNHKIALLAFLSFSACALLFFRMLVERSFGFDFLVWNLFLAWVPLLFIKWISEIDKRKSLHPLTLLFSLIIWLLFFPNAPYIITDLKHLSGIPENKIWYDAMMIFTFAVAGLLPGLYSIRIVYRILSTRFHALICWCLIAASMFLSGFGIFLGRYGRWNSWDIVTQPQNLFWGILGSIRNPMAVMHTFAFSFVLLLLYFAFHTFAEINKNEPTHKFS